VPISAVDTISLAFQHTRRQLFQPFRFGQWARLALVGLLAGEMGGGNFNLPSNFNIPKDTNSSHQFLSTPFPHIDPAILGTVIAIAIIAGLIFMVVMTYISSVMRFILFDSVLTKQCHIRQGWSRRQDPGWKFFLWQIGFMLVMLLAMSVFIGLPALYAYTHGWFSAPDRHVMGLILGGIAMFCVVVVFCIAVAVVHVFTKDFVVPQMALEGIDAIEGWRRLWPMVQAEKSGYVIYALMKIVLAIGAGIAIGIVSVILGLIIAVPVIGAIIAAAAAGGPGFSWNVFTITAAIVGGCILFALFFFLVALITVPAIVFFPAYSMYFFAPRYRALSLALYPPAPGAVMGAPPPDLPPAPQPAF